MIGGEILLQRIQRQFGGIVISENKDILRHSGNFSNVGETKNITETLRRVIEKFGEMDYTILLGDVYYTDILKDKIKNCNELMFFINFSDVLAIKWPAEDTSMIKSKLKEVDGKLWHLYRAVNGKPLDVHKIYKYATRAGDNSRDFDIWEQYKKYVKRKAI